MYKLKDVSTGLFLSAEGGMLVSEADAGVFDDGKANLFIWFYKDRDGVVFSKVKVEG